MEKSSQKIKSIKDRTLELYDSLPQERRAREARIDVRDQIIELNYKFFGYIAANTFINNSSVSYEDKFQSALTHFCECWWKYRWKGDETHPGYRTDLAFGVFFKPRISEMIERELQEVKYSVRRTLCMEAGAQLGKHWAKVRYEDLANVDLPADKMNSLKAIFGTLYTADLEEHELYLEAPQDSTSIFDNPSDKYESIEDLLIHDMIIYETKLTDDELQKMSEIYGIDFEVLKSKLPIAEKLLYNRLHESLELKEL